MLRLLLLPAVCLALISPAHGGGTITWPNPPTSAGGNSAAIAAPAISWLDSLQKKIDDSRKMKEVDLIFDGDSITAGWMSRGISIWNSHYAKLNAFDFGYPGDQTQHLLWRLQNGQIDNLHPKLVVLLIGTNNLPNKPDEIAAAVQAIIAEYQKRCPGAVILLQGIFPRGQAATDPQRERIKSINLLISKFADDKKVIYLDFGDKFLQPDGTISAEIMGDFLHPTPKGYEIWAAAIQQVIDQYFPPEVPAATPSTSAPSPTTSAPTPPVSQ